MFILAISLGAAPLGMGPSILVCSMVQQKKAVNLTDVRRYLIERSCLIKLSEQRPLTASEQQKLTIYQENYKNYLDFLQRNRQQAGAQPIAAQQSAIQKPIIQEPIIQQPTAQHTSKHKKIYSKAAINKANAKKYFRERRRRLHLLKASLKKPLTAQEQQELAVYEERHESYLEFLREAQKRAIQKREAQQLEAHELAIQQSIAQRNNERRRARENAAEIKRHLSEYKRLLTELACQRPLTAQEQEDFLIYQETYRKYLDTLREAL